MGSADVRILSVAAYVSADGAYGGPVSVALDHAAVLTQLGHHVTLAAGWDGRVRPESPATLRLFRAYKPLRSTFAGLVAPGLLAWVLRHAEDFDVVHAHITRDLVTLPAARFAQLRRVPVVLQTHGQIRPERSWGQALLDVVLARSVFQKACAVLALTGREESDLRRFGLPDERIQRIDNGVPLAARHARFVTESPVILFNSRIAPRKRPRAFVAAAEIVAESRPDARFEMWGPDGGELEATLAEIERRGLTGRCVYRGATTVSDARNRLADATVLVLPSTAEPFPMTVLEAFAAGLPTVITDQTGLSDICRSSGAGIVTDGSAEQMAAAVLTLIGSSNAWLESSASARGLAEQRYSMRQRGLQLLRIFRACQTSPQPVKK